MFETIIGIVVLLVLWLAVTIRYSILLPTPKGLRILMYHKVSSDHSDGITVTTEQLRMHFDYLKKRQYNIISFKDFFNYLDSNTPLPKRSTILTFDDGYQNNCELLYPLLEEYNYNVTVFLPLKYIGATNLWDDGKEKIMSEHTILNTASKLVNYGLHSFEHKDYRNLSIDDIEKDIKLCVEGATQKNIPFVNVLAYPYGGMPKDIDGKEALKNLLLKYNIRLGLRIGNKVNRLPLRKPHEVKRIDIRGTDSFFEFKTKLKKGRIKMF